MFNLKITNDTQEKPFNKGLKAENLPYILLLITIFVLPILFLPLSVASLDATKMYFVYGVAFISFFIWLLLKLREQNFSLPFNLLSLSLALIAVTYTLAGVFSDNLSISFFGRDFAGDSVMAIVAFIVLLIISATQFNNKTKIAYAYLAYLGSFILVSIVHLINILVPIMPTLGFFGNNVTTTLGKWNELSIMSVVTVILTIITLFFVRLNKNTKILVYTSLSLGILMMIIVNFKLAWYILAAFTLIFFVYLIVGFRKDNDQNIPFLPLVIFLVSFLFLIAGETIGGYVSNVLNINHFEVRPAISTTLNIAKETYKEDPIFGVGPALFEQQWIQYRPDRILGSDFWNFDFRYGFGLIFSFFTTTGILGSLAWIFFIGIFLYSGFNAIFKHINDFTLRYLLLSSFVVSAIFWVTTIFYIPSVVIIASAYIFTGIFMAALIQANLFNQKQISMEGDSKMNFIYVTSVVILLLLSIGITYKATDKFSAHTYFQRATYSLNVEGDLDRTEALLQQAIRLDQTDTYYRSVAELGEIRLNQILNTPNTPEDILRDQFSNVLRGTINNYQSAINYDPNNYNNYIGLASLYQSLASLNFDGSYDQAATYLSEVEKLNPNSPALILRKARLEAITGNFEGAQDYIQEALNKKPNYVEAIFFFSQIQVAQGNIEEAVQAVRTASLIRPNDPSIFFQLGLLHYNNNAFDSAITSFERAVIINPQFQNAKYFLGLSYDQVGRTDAAISQFEDLSLLNPDNQEVQLILDNLKSGLSPFSGAESPIDSEPESREELPLDEEVDTNEETVTE